MLALPLSQEAQAAARAAVTTTINAGDDSPLRWMELDGTRADFRSMPPTDRDAQQTFEGRTFFVYVPAAGEFNLFSTRTLLRTASSPNQVLLADTDLIHSHPHVKLRRGDPDRPDRARVVASAAVVM
ncbi:hypothetical protein ABZX75_33970 [Streptomyces sp. NPDC003038]|uniref:hypothetical protein n=1 Tax=unclassified Streptomyces TaxID=2593676 RepID=UPI0033AFC8E1